jgi:hypothetical protein
MYTSSRTVAGEGALYNSARKCSGESDVCICRALVAFVSVSGVGGVHVPAGTATCVVPLNIGAVFAACTLIVCSWRTCEAFAWFFLRR